MKELNPNHAKMVHDYFKSISIGCFGCIFVPLALVVGYPYGLAFTTTGLVILLYAMYKSLTSKILRSGFPKDEQRRIMKTYQFSKVTILYAYIIMAMLIYLSHRIFGLNAYETLLASAFIVHGVALLGLNVFMYRLRGRIRTSTIASATTAL